MNTQAVRCIFFAFRRPATLTMTTTTTTTTAFARSGGKLDRVGISRNQCTTSKERTTFPKG